MQIEKQEGELYKKLIEIGRKAYIPCAGQEKTVIVPYLQVLDEAKQDFPNCQKCNENQPMKPCSFIAYTSDFPQFTICTPLKEWFKKCFGER